VVKVGDVGVEVDGFLVGGDRLFYFFFLVECFA
jgi:hypothetical protein